MQLQRRVLYTMKSYSIRRDRCVHVIPVYGMTEALLWTGVPIADCDKKPASSGVVFPDNELKVRLADYMMSPRRSSY